MVTYLDNPTPSPDTRGNAEVQLPTSYAIGGVVVDLSVRFSSLYKVVIRRVVTKPNTTDRVEQGIYEVLIGEVYPNCFQFGKFVLTVGQYTPPSGPPPFASSIVEIPNGTNLGSYYVELDVEGWK